MPNYDETTGIHYGVISPHSISQETLNDLINDSTDTIYEETKREFREKLFDILNEWLSTDECDIIIDEACDRMSERYENDYHGYEFKDSEYELKICDDNFGIFVIKSPYYTYTRQCSPCAPGAGDLDSPITKQEYDKAGDYTRSIDVFGITHKIGLKTYCLPRDFFDKDYAQIPYRYYRVSDDSEVLEDIIEVD